MKSLIKSLRWAHASEIAAYWAYIGHWESLKDPIQQANLAWIVEDEEDHVIILGELLSQASSRPNRLLDSCFEIVGKTLGFLCKHTGWYLPMKVAHLMETIGRSSYNKMADDAFKHGDLILYEIFKEMADVEKEHELYFKGVLNENRSQSRKDFKGSQRDYYISVRPGIG